MQAAVFAVLAAIFAALVLHQTQRLRVPPQTAVTMSFDFSDNLGNIAHGEHRIYAMANGAFAEAFETANAARLWTDDLRARRARREVVVAAIGGAILLAALAIAMLK